MRRAVARIRNLATEPRPQGAETLTADDKYRDRQDNYRFLYQIDDGERLVTIVKIADRAPAPVRPRPGGPNSRPAVA